MTRWGIAAVVLGAGLLLAGCGGGPSPSAAVPSTTHVVESLSASVAPAQAGPTAESVVDDFQLAGLPVPHARDNSANCTSLKLGCSQLITTDAISVLTFPDVASAAHYATAFGDGAHRQGTVVLEYTAAKTPTADRPKYEAELAKQAG